MNTRGQSTRFVDEDCTPFKHAPPRPGLLPQFFERVHFVSDGKAILLMAEELAIHRYVDTIE